MNIEIDVEYLIAMIYQNPCIWDKTDEGYHSRTETDEAWRNVCYGLNEQFEELPEKDKIVYEKFVTKKWRNIRDQWLKSTKKEEHRKKSGENIPRSRPYIHQEHLSFLAKTLTGTDETIHLESPASHKNPGQPRFFNKTGAVKDEVGRPESPASTGDRTPGPSLRKTKAPTTAEEGVRKTAKVDLEKPTLFSVCDDDPKVLFFKGILPHMADFTGDENLQFQSGVLNLIQTIRKQRSSDKT